MNQLGIPTVVSAQEVMRERSLGGSIDLCAKAAGLEPKQVQTDLKLDKAQWSRWTDGKEGILWPKLKLVMDHCGNHAPLMWMNHDCGFDISAMRHRESELERQLREAREENAALKRLLLAR